MTAMINFEYSVCYCYLTYLSMKKKAHEISWNWSNSVLKIVNSDQLLPVPDHFFQIRGNLIITMDKAIKTKQNRCKRLTRQSILNTKICQLWQHGPRIGISREITMYTNSNTSPTIV